MVVRSVPSICTARSKSGPGRVGWSLKSALAGPQAMDLPRRVATAVSPLGRLLRFVRVAVVSVTETRELGVVVFLTKPTVLLAMSGRAHPERKARASGRAGG